MNTRHVSGYMRYPNDTVLRLPETNNSLHTPGPCHLGETPRYPENAVKILKISDTYDGSPHLQRILMTSNQFHRPISFPSMSCTVNTLFRPRFRQRRRSHKLSFHNSDMQTLILLNPRLPYHPYRYHCPVGPKALRSLRKREPKEVPRPLGQML